MVSITVTDISGILHKPKTSDISEILHQSARDPTKSFGSCTTTNLLSVPEEPHPLELSHADNGPFDTPLTDPSHLTSKTLLDVRRKSTKLIAKWAPHAKVSHHGKKTLILVSLFLTFF